MKQLMAITLMTLALAGAAPSAHALSPTDYLEERQRGDQIVQGALDMYVMGLGHALHWANVHAEGANGSGKGLYCPPAHLRFTGNHFRHILDDTLERAKASPLLTQDRDKFGALGFWLLAGLRDTFPCPLPR
jgi:hypothetical protein